MFSFALLNHTLLFSVVFHYLFTMMRMFKMYLYHQNYLIVLPNE